MTVRTAELVMAIFMALCSIGLMVKSAELNIGWVPERGPGAGAWPFWLSAGMLLCCLLTLYRWIRRITPESRNLNLYMTRETVIVVGTSAGAILFLLSATHFIGLYMSLMFFLLFYLRVIGRHTWKLTATLTISIPVFIFCLFEWALKIPLPKAITEPWFYPVYDLMYS
ncbi:MAG: tripartite tricarboxylate transporter TctB family protein [Gammaproteobacteria bacterium]|nr:tripartite tricarboxylate transporter TctB family protein [Gammaproteobacteria bacterium]